MNKDSPQNPEKNLHLLSFIDVIDRVDILLLEIRHLQQNIIYALRTPDLYRPLRYEENHIFSNKGENSNKIWAELIHNLSDESKEQQESKYSKKYIIRYPSPKKATDHYHKYHHKDHLEHLKKKRERVVHLVTQCVGKIWLGDDWGHDLRLQYHTLRALQILKQQVFLLKLSLIKAAIAADLISTNSQHQSKLSFSAFAILRRGVLYKLRYLISALSSHRQQISQMMDFGVQKEHRSSIERRREIGIYMDYMTSRGREIQRDMRDLLKSFGLKNPGKKLPRPLLFHSWSHHYRVENVQLYDDVSDNLNKYGMIQETAEMVEDDNIQHTAYIKTSFWSPDRPDLQPIIAREVAFSLVRNQLKGLDDSALATLNDDFTGLIIKLRSVILKYSKKHPELNFLEEKVHEYSRILAYDFLAVTIKGIPYLYSLFLLRFANDLEKQLSVGIGHEIGLDMAYILHKGTAPFKTDILWHLQLTLVSTWAEQTAHLKLTKLDRIVIDGTKKTANELLHFLNKSRPANRAQNFTKAWEKMAKSLNKTLIKSTAIRKAKRWRKKRSKDYRNEVNNKAGECKYARTTRRLDIRLQSFLFDIILEQKKSKTESNPILNIRTYEDFEKKYSVDLFDKNDNKIIQKALNNTNKELHPRKLFRHLYDIPFQCAIMRSIDLLSFNSNSEKKWLSLINDIHNDLGLGRDLFSLALEFYIKDIESPRHRLLLCINLLTYQYNRLRDNELKEKISNWIGTQKDNEKHSLDCKKIKNSKYSKLHKKFSSNGVIKFGATQIASKLSTIQAYDTKSIRKIERLAGLKLKELHWLLKEQLKGERISKERKPLLHLMHWLAIRNDSKDHQDISCSMHKFYNTLFEAFCPTVEMHGGKKYLTPLKISLISRISMANPSPIPNPLVPADFSYTDNKNLSLKNIWETPIKNEGTKSISHLILGKFDAIIIRPIQIPCRCVLHTFDPNNKTTDNPDEEFIPYFSRKEIAFQIDLSKEFDSENVFYISAITLQRRAMRLGFLYTLIRISQAIIKNSNDNILKTEIGKLLNSNEGRNINIRIYLSDGWNDLQLLFSKNIGQLNANDIKWAFKLQRAFFHDFMVDRTEMMLTPDCLDAAHKCEEFKISIHTKIHRDGWLEKSSKLYIDHLNNNDKKKDFGVNSINQVPGSTDFRIELECGKQYKDRNIHDDILNWMSNKTTKAGEVKQPTAIQLTDHIETYIEHIQSGNKH